MTNRDKFIDAMSVIDEDLLTAHFQRKCPTKAQKIRKYVMAAAIYAAACFVIALVLPFIIGKGETPVPKPGDSPIKTETVAPEPDAPDKNHSLPRAETTFHGCEFSITLDKESYVLGDGITATVTLTNKGTETVELWQGYLGNYLDDIQFYENGEVRQSYSADWFKGYEWEGQNTSFEPGDSITHSVRFTPGAPNTTDDPVAREDSKWEITASVSYYLDGEDREPDIQTATVTIEVPHGEDNAEESETNTLPLPDSIPVKMNRKAVSFDAENSSNQYNLITEEISRTLSPTNIAAVYSYFNIENIPESTCVDYVYYDPHTVYLKEMAVEAEHKIEAVRRVMFTLDEDIFYMIFICDDDKLQVYEINNYRGIIDVMEKIMGEDVTVPPDTDRVDPIPKPAPDDQPKYEETVMPTAITAGIGGKTVKLNAGSAEFEKITTLCDKNLSHHTQIALSYKTNESGVQEIKTNGIFVEISFDSMPYIADGKEISNIQRIFFEFSGEKPVMWMSTSAEYEGETIGFPVPYPNELLKLVSEIVNGKDSPREKLEVDGLEYTVILDKEFYTVNDKVIATVILENTGSKTITLCKGSSGHFLSTVNFYVVGEPMGSMRPSNGHFGETEVPVKQYETFAPGEVLSYVEWFNISEADTTKKWNVSAHIEYYDVDKDKTENLDSKYFKLNTLYVEVPHDITTSFEPEPIVPVITEDDALSAVAKDHGVTVEYLRERVFGVDGADMSCELVSKGDTDIYRVTFLELISPQFHGGNFENAPIEEPLNGTTTDYKMSNGGIFDFYGYRYVYEVDANSGKILSKSKTFSGDVEATHVAADPSIVGSVVYDYYAFCGSSMKYIDNYGILKTSRYTKNKDKLGNGSGHLPVLEFRNSDQFTEFSDDIENYFKLGGAPISPGMANFLHQKERFGDEFFENYNLYLVGLIGPYSAYNHYFNSVTVKNGVLNFEILTDIDYSDSWMSTETSVYVLFAVPKDQLTNVTSVDCTNPYSYRYD